VDPVVGVEENQENQEPEEVGAAGAAGAATFAPRLLFRMDTLLDTLLDTLRDALLKTFLDILRRLFPNGPAEFISIFSV
jgi:hypothetical protein